jgi:hypothetical protein
VRTVFDVGLSTVANWCSHHTAHHRAGYVGLSLAYRLASLEVSSLQFSRELSLKHLTISTPFRDASGQLLCSALLSAAVPN